MRIFFTIFIFLMIFSGCSQKTVYNQTSSKYIDVDNLADQIDSDLQSKEENYIGLKTFKDEKMNSFVLFADKIYSSIESKKREVAKYSLGGKLGRDAVLYNLKTTKGK